MTAARRIACLYTHPLQLRAMRPLAAKCRCSLLTDDVVELADWCPDVVVTNDAGELQQLRQYADGCHAFVVGLRHGSANKYIGPDPEYALADYVCGSDFDETDFRSHGVWPRRGFLLTGNPWMDDLFSLPARVADRSRPTVLLAPTYNPETSALAVLSGSFVSEVRQVFPESRILIKPHPLIFETRLSWVREAGLAPVFERWVADLRAAARDPLVQLVEDPAISIAECFAESDLLVSDGSSLVFEFMALGRPILLYSSRRRVGIWKEAWDPRAPGNAWRDVGTEFSSHRGFRLALREAFSRHDTVHAERQREHSQVMYGRWRDGRASERIVAALENLPRLEVKVFGRAEALPRVVRNAAISPPGAELPEPERLRPAEQDLESVALSVAQTTTAWTAHVRFLDAAASLLGSNPALDGVVSEGDQSLPSVPGSVWRRCPPAAPPVDQASVATRDRESDCWTTSLVRRRHTVGARSDGPAALVLYAWNERAPTREHFQIVRFGVARPAGGGVCRVRIVDAQDRPARAPVVVPASPASREVYAVVATGPEPARVEVFVDARSSGGTTRRSSREVGLSALLVNVAVAEDWPSVLNPSRPIGRELWQALCSRERLEAEWQWEAARKALSGGSPRPAGVSAVAPECLRWPDDPPEPSLWGGRLACSSLWGRRPACLPRAGRLRPWGFDAQGRPRYKDQEPPWLSGLRVLVPWVAWRCALEGHRKVAVFGAGRHSEEAIRMWRAFRGPSIETIVVSQAGGPSSVCGVPVLPADQFDARAVDAIVLSSALYEPQMAAVCRARWPWLPVYGFWSGTTTPADVERRILLARAALPWIAGRARREHVERVVLVADADARFLVPVWQAWQGPPLELAVPEGSAQRLRLPGVRAASLKRVRLGRRDAILVASAACAGTEAGAPGEEKAGAPAYLLPF